MRTSQSTSSKLLRTQILILPWLYVWHKHRAVVKYDVDSGCLLKCCGIGTVDIFTTLTEGNWAALSIFINWAAGREWGLLGRVQLS